VNGQLQNTFVLPLKPQSEEGAQVTFANAFTVQQTGRVGYSVRVSPNQFENPLTRPCNSPLKWVSE
jgi:starch phosphorylase